MAYRDEKEEKGPRVVHEWHLLPAFPKFGEDVFLRVFGFCIMMLMITGTLLLVGWGGCYFYDWRMGRLH